jgi:RNA polymerase sigma factor (sigma-70 family)
MAGASMTAALRQVDRLFREGTLAALTDDEALGRYLDDGDEDAFAALVARHGPMVLTACLEVLRNTADAEDAFQATFVTLVHRAGSIRGRDCVGGWLRRVARRCAFRINAAALRRRRREQIAAASSPRTSGPPVGASLERDELSRVLSMEIDHLPEPYRHPVVLCLQEGLPQSEAAGRLCVSVGVIRGRLARGRAMLRDRLRRRGVTPAVPIGTRPEGIDSPLVPAAWVEAVLAAARDITARRAALAGWAGASARIPAAALILVCVATLALGLASTMPTPEPPASTAFPVQAARRSQLVSTSATVDAKPTTGSGRTIVLRGKVFGPEGRLVAGARLHLVADPWDPWANPVERGTSGVDGSYRIALPEETFRHNFDDGTSPQVRITLIATASGLGAGWVEFQAVERDGKPAMKPEYAHDFQLAAEFPIAGRIVNASGKPVAGAVVAVRSVSQLATGRWEPVLAALQAFDPSFLMSVTNHSYKWSEPINPSAWKAIAPATTDAYGRFKIVGIGRDRLTDVRVMGPGVQPVNVSIVTRDDVADVTRAFRAKYPQKRKHQVFDPFPTIVVDAARTVAGVVRDARTGEPIPGLSLGIWAQHIGIGGAETDANGRYRGVFSGNGPSISVYTYAHGRSPWPERYLSAARQFSDARESGEIVADFDIQRGVVVSGRVLESGTGRPIVSAPRYYCHDKAPIPLRAGFVYYYPLAINAALRGRPAGLFFEGLSTGEAIAPRAEIDGDGRFKLAVPPGPGVLLVRAQPGLPMLYDQADRWKESDGLYRLFPYAPLTVRAKDDGAPDGDSRSLAGFVGPISLATYHAYRVINPPADAAALDVEIAIARAPSRLLRFFGPDGRPVRGVTVSGLMAPPLPMVVLDGWEAEVLALDPARPRELIAISNDGMYFARTVVRVADPPRRTIWLEPIGSVSGRLLDAATGRPLAGYQAMFTLRPNQGL